ncbi:MAG: hypothetical protein IKF91_03785 [Bacilli bacterium]|nr:hypothetical protein [Bacilli bacterium]
MTLMELYDSIKNPLEDSDVIKRLISAYASSALSLGGFYSKLINTVQKEHVNGQYYVKDADKFYSMMFNKWKNSIVSMTKDDFDELYRRGSFGLDFIKMREYLKSVPDVSTMEESNEIFSGSKVDAELKKALDKYKWSSFGENSGWVHVCSRYLTAKKDEYPNVEHRLYLNTESLDTYKMITLFVQKCDEYHLPYYFKFDEYADRDDTIVVYSSTENLSKYIDILEEIKRENPLLVSRIKKPPVLTGQLDGFIGYGSEPLKTSDGKLQSFNGVRSKIIEDVLSKLFRKYVGDNYDSIRNGLIAKINETIIEDAKWDYNDRLRVLKNREKKFGEKFDPNDAFDYYGYKPGDIDSDSFKQLVNRIVSSTIDNILQGFIDGGRIGNIKIPVSNGKFINFYNSRITDCINSYVAQLVIQDEDFINQVRDNINESIKDTDIDSDKFCFDKHAIVRLEQVDALNSNNYGGDTLRVNVNDSNALYDNKLNEEFLNLLQELKNPSYDRKERSKFVVRVEQIIEIYRSEIRNDEFADTLVKAFNNAQKIYEDGVQKMEPNPSTTRYGKHFKAVHLEDKLVNMSEDMESKMGDEVNDRVQKINGNVYKTSSQKVSEMLDKKMAEINRRVDNGETLDSNIDDLSRYVSDLTKRKEEINEQFKEAWVSSDEDEFNKLLEEDNNLKSLISNRESEIERKSRIRDIVDEQIEREKVTSDIEEYASDVDFINNNSSLSDEQKKILIDGIYAEFDKYVEAHPEEKVRSRR